MSMDEYISGFSENIELYDSVAKILRCHMNFMTEYYYPETERTYFSPFTSKFLLDKYKPSTNEFNAVP